MPDVVLMDLVMPEMDGFVAIQQLRKLPTAAPCCIIAISATVSEAQRRQVLTAGADAFLEKPFKHEKLLELLAQLLHVEWEYANEEEKPPLELGNEIAFPPTDSLLEFLELSKLGHIQGIIELAHALEKNIPNTKFFAKKFTP